MRRAAAVLMALAAWALPLRAQGDAMTRAFEQERRGNYAGAADAYLEALRANPGNLSALLGLERVLVPLRRESELAGPASALLASDPANTVAYSVAMRGWAAARRPDSIAAVALRWARVEPGSETPYRDWGNTLLGLQDPAGARKAYLTGREALGEPAALAGELALLAGATGDWRTAAREWGAAIERYPGYRLTARNALLRAPEASRDDILRELSHQSPAGRRLAAELEVQWGDPAAGWTLLAANLPASNPEALEALRQFLDAARGGEGPEAARVRGNALEQVAARTSGQAASRTRLEAARAYADGGDPAAARRMLGQLASDTTAPPDMAAGATATLVTVLLREGDVEEAARQLARYRSALGEDNAERLTLQVADGYLRQGQLAAAEALLDSAGSVEAVARIGRIRLYQGDLAGAAKALGAAGPFAGSREEATQRTGLLALIQPIAQDSLPALGAALLALERGDSATAVQGLVAVAATLPPNGGGAGILLLAGRIEAARGQADAAERLLRSAADSTAPATAPSAELELARLLLALGRTADAERELEHLILAYPGSAVVPEARRLLDTARGGVPES